jgi:hypothetical protein
LPRMRMIEDLAADWCGIDARVDAVTEEVTALAREDAGAERLMSVPGIGPIIPAPSWRRSAPVAQPAGVRSSGAMTACLFSSAELRAMHPRLCNVRPVTLM